MFFNDNKKLFKWEEGKLKLLVETHSIGRKLLEQTISPKNKENRLEL